MIFVGMTTHPARHTIGPSRLLPPVTNMRTIYKALALTLVASTLSAQSFSFGLRGSGTMPTGSFAETPTSATANPAVIEGAKTGFGYGLDVALSLGVLGI